MQHLPSSRHPEPSGKQSPDSVRNIAPDQGSLVVINADVYKIGTLVPCCNASVSTDEQKLGDLTLRNRVARVLRDIFSGRTVSDADLLQHREDTTFLHECAHHRWLATNEEKHLVEVYAWIAHRNEAIGLLSPQRRAQEPSAAYFIDQGERDRARLIGAAA